MIPLSLTAVAYMSVTTFICDDYTTCLKIINCITHVMIILGPCRNNDFFLSDKFQAGRVCIHEYKPYRQERPSLLFFVWYMLCMLHFTHKCKLTQFPQNKIKNLTGI